MELELKLVFAENCKEFNRPESDIEEPLKLLNRNFFYKLKDLKRLDIDSWIKLGLPMNLFYLLQDKITLYESKNYNPFEMTSKPIIITSSSNTSNIKQDENIIKIIKVVDEKELKSNFKTKVDKISAEAKIESEIIQVLKTLHGIIDRIVKNPLDSSVQRINMNSKVYLTKIAINTSAVELLYYLGFELIKNNQGLYLVYEGKFELLKQALIEFEDYLKEKSK